MSRGVIVIISLLAIILPGCDTKSNVKPRNEDFFIKYYAGVKAGNQFANDIIATSDGGLLIVGTSENKDDLNDLNTIEIRKELVLIKTDAKGNQEWIYGAGQDLAASESEGKSVIEVEGDGYVVGGVINGVLDRSVLLKIDFDGNILMGPLEIITYDSTANEEKENRLSKITLGHSGILMTGETTHPAGAGVGGLNGFIGLIDEQSLTQIAVGSKYTYYFGKTNDDRVTGAYEIADPINSINTGGDNSRFLVFGSTDDIIPGEFDFYYAGFTESFGESPGIGSTTIEHKGGSNEYSNYLTRIDDTYLMIGEFNDNTSAIYLVGWEFNPTFPPASRTNDWKTIAGSGRVTPSDGVIGKGLAIQNTNKAIIVGDIQIAIDQTEIYLAGINNNLSINTPWPKTYGTTAATYTASAVTVLADGSIVTVGTADLQPIKKIIVIKTGPDGQMSF